MTLMEFIKTPGFGVALAASIFYGAMLIFGRKVLLSGLDGYSNDIKDKIGGAERQLDEALKALSEAKDAHEGFSVQKAELERIAREQVDTLRKNADAQCRAFEEAAAERIRLKENTLVAQAEECLMLFVLDQMMSHVAEKTRAMDGNTSLHFFEQNLSSAVSAEHFV